MDAYSEINAIYFSVAERTGYARYLQSQLLTGSYVGCPPYKRLIGAAAKSLRQFHSAEHQVYNAFMMKIKTISHSASLAELRLQVPTLIEAKQASDFSIFCGTTFFFSSGFLLICSCLPNLFHFHNTSLYFMSFWLIFSIFLTLMLTRFIQHQFFLAKPEEKHLFLAIEALKEALNE